MGKKQYKNWQAKLHEIIYEADTPAGKLFDVVLLIAGVVVVDVVVVVVVCLLAVRLL